VKHWEDEVKERVDRPLAVSKRQFSKREVKALIEQAMRSQTGADFAFMNEGGVRDTVPAGQFAGAGTFWDIMPFDNRVLIGKFKGRDPSGGRPGKPPGGARPRIHLGGERFHRRQSGTAENLRTSGLQFPDDVGLLRDVLIDWFRKKKVMSNGQRDSSQSRSGGAPVSVLLLAAEPANRKTRPSVVAPLERIRRARK